MFTYEGIKEVKNSKLNVLLHEYEMFIMLPQESISDMFTHFTKIVTSLHSLGCIVTNSKKTNKILHYFLKL